MMERLQPVITLIDSDLPVRAEHDAPVFTAGEIVTTLHDGEDHSRIFKMRGRQFNPQWFT